MLCYTLLKLFFFLTYSLIKKKIAFENMEVYIRIVTTKVFPNDSFAFETHCFSLHRIHPKNYLYSFLYALMHLSEN